LLKHFLNPPNWFTSASIFCSVYAMALILAEPGSVDPATLDRACILIIFSGIFDLLDGRVARMTKRFTQFGVQLDSIADVIGFGLAPAMIAWVWILKDLGSFGMLITFWYVLAAAFRLARFNVDANEHTWELNGHSQGLTTTTSGGMLVTFVWMLNGQHVSGPSTHAQLAFVSASFVTLLGLLMVSSIPFRNFKDLRNNRRARRILAISLAVCIATGVATDTYMILSAAATLYLIAGLLDGVVTAIWFRRESLAYANAAKDDDDF
jgi:CDP-diacylglycerol--serine O-phosphatidyltransferase